MSEKLPLRSGQEREKRANTSEGEEKSFSEERTRDLTCRRAVSVRPCCRSTRILRTCSWRSRSPAPASWAGPAADGEGVVQREEEGGRREEWSVAPAGGARRRSFGRERRRVAITGVSRRTDMAGSFLAEADQGGRKAQWAFGDGGLVMQSGNMEGRSIILITNLSFGDGESRGIWFSFLKRLSREIFECFANDLFGQMLILAKPIARVSTCIELFHNFWNATRESS